MLARISEEKLCALMLGELGDTERRALEAVLQKDPASEQALGELREAAGVVAEVLGPPGPDAPGLSAEQRRRLLDAAGVAAVAGVAADQGIDVEVDVEDPSRAADDSDLFSLGNLQTLTRSDAASAQAATGGGDETSGLVDLRSLAQAREDEDEPGISELLNLGPGGSAGLSPVVAPEVVERRRNVMLGIGAGLAAALVIAGLVVVLVRHVGRPDPVDENERAIAMLIAEIESLKQTGVEGGAEMERLEGQLAEEQARKETMGEEWEEARPAAAKQRRPAGTARPAAAEAPPAASPRPKAEGVSELDDLLGGSATRPSKRPAAKTGGAGAIPDQLSRNQVQSGMQSVVGAVRNCGKGAGGTITVRATISPAGRVTAAKTQGAHAGTAVGTCAEKAVRRASFPRAKNSLDVSYPFKL